MSTDEKGLSRVTPRLIRLRDAPFYLGMDRCDDDGEYDAIECCECKGSAPADVWNKRGKREKKKCSPDS